MSLRPLHRRLLLIIALVLATGVFAMRVAVHADREVAETVQPYDPLRSW